MPTHWELPLCPDLVFTDAKPDTRRPHLLFEMEYLFGTSFRGVRLLHAPAIARWHAAALTAGDTILFAEPLTDSAAPDAKRLLAHELTHVLQQRAGRVAARSHCMFLDAGLEAEADLAGEFAAAGRSLRGLFPCHEQRAHAAGGPLAFQPVLIVNAGTIGKGTPPNPSASFNPFEIKLYEYMVDSPSPVFSYPSEHQMIAFIKKYALLYSQNPTKFSDRFKLFFAPISGASAAIAPDKKLAKWTVDITITTKDGPCKIPVFTSVKRHLVLSFMENQFSPREIKPDNSLVRNETLFEAKLLAYAAALAADMRNQPFLFGYVPKDFVHVDSEIKFETDTTELPNTVYPGQENAIHCFPASGSAVRSGISRDQYNAICKFLFWFFRTEEHLCEGVAYNRVDRISIHDISSRAAKLGRMAELKDAIIAALKILHDGYKVPAVPPASLDDLALKLAAVKNVKPHYMQLLAEASRNLYLLLIEHGLKPAISGAASARKDKPADYRAASSSTGVVRFRTHLCEVKALSHHLTPDLVAFLIDGYVARSGHEVLTYITDTTASTKPNIINQVQKASQDTLKTFTNEPSAAVRLRNLYDLYELAIAEKILP